MPFEWNSHSLFASFSFFPFTLTHHIETYVLRVFNQLNIVCVLLSLFFWLNILLGIVGAALSVSQHKTFAQALAKEGRRREKLERKIRTNRWIDDTRLNVKHFQVDSNDEIHGSVVAHLFIYFFVFLCLVVQWDSDDENKRKKNTTKKSKHFTCGLMRGDGVSLRFRVNEIWWHKTSYKSSAVNPECLVLWHNTIMSTHTHIHTQTDSVLKWNARIHRCSVVGFGCSCSWWRMRRRTQSRVQSSSSRSKASES